MDISRLDPVAFRVGPLAVRWYGLAYVSGFVAAALLVRRAAARWRLGISDDDLLNMVLGAVIGVVLGGRLGYVLFYGDGYYLKHPAQVFATWDGGMSFHGGLIGIIIASVAVSRIIGISWLRLCDLGSIGAPVGLGLGRLANFVNGELWGRVTERPWGVVFPAAGPLPRHPSQLYEAALEGAVLLAIMLWLTRNDEPRPEGELLGWLLAFYGAMRVAVEFFREPDAQLGFVAGRWLTMGMVLSVPMIALGIGLIVRARSRVRGSNQSQS